MGVYAMGRVIVKFSSQRMGFCLYEVIDELSVEYFDGPYSNPEAENLAYDYNNMIREDNLIEGDV